MENHKKLSKEILEIEYHYSKSTEYLEDYKNWECKSIRCFITNKLYDQIKYICKLRNITIRDFLKDAIMYYMKKVTPKEYDLSKLYVSHIEDTKIKNKPAKPDKENTVVENSD